MHNGTYELSYATHVAGQYNLQVYCDGIVLKACPAQIMVHAAAAAPVLCTAEVLQGELLVGDRCTVRVAAFDEYHNRILNGLTKFVGWWRGIDTDAEFQVVFRY